MRNKTISVLATAAFSICVGFAATSSATAAPAIGQMQTSAYAGSVPLLQQTFGPRKNKYIEHPKTGYVDGKKVGPNWLKPKVCYERKRLGPQKYVIVRRAC